MVEPLVNRIKSFYPRGKTDSELHDLLNHIYEVTSQFITLPPKDKLRFVISSRLTRKTGVFRFKVNKDGSNDLSITLSRKLLIDIDSNAEVLWSCVAHELAHASNFTLFCMGMAPISGHDGTFLTDICLLNSIFKNLKQITIHHNQPVPFKWYLRCSFCNKIVRKLVHRGKLRKSLSHRLCGGLLSYERIPGNFCILQNRHDMYIGNK